MKQMLHYYNFSHPLLEEMPNFIYDYIPWDPEVDNPNNYPGTIEMDLGQFEPVLPSEISEFTRFFLSTFVVDIGSINYVLKCIESHYLGVFSGATDSVQMNLEDMYRTVEKLGTINEAIQYLKAKKGPSGKMKSEKFTRLANSAHKLARGKKRLDKHLKSDVEMLADFLPLLEGNLRAVTPKVSFGRLYLKIASAMGKIAHSLNNRAWNVFAISRVIRDSLGYYVYPLQRCFQFQPNVTLSDLDFSYVQRLKELEDGPIQ